MENQPVKRALIIAAGMGSRLEQHTQDRPKCMVKVQGRSIIDYQLESLRANGIEDIHIVTGYLADKLIVEGATYYRHENYKETNILHSAMQGLDAFHGPLLTTYSDIIYSKEVVKKLLDTPGDIVLTVDKAWAKVYEGRDKHPIEQAELTEVDSAGRVKRVGKWVGAEHCVGEFIGLAKYSAKGAEIVRNVWQDLRSKLSDNERFRNAALFRKAYLADLFEEIIGRNYPIEVAYIESGWREIDTVQDLDRVNRDYQING